MKQISIKQSIIRSFIIWLISIVITSLIYGVFVSFIQDYPVNPRRGSLTFIEILYIFIAIYSILSFPSLLFMFFSFRYIYKKANTVHSRIWALFFLGVINSISVLAIIYYYMRGDELLSLGLLYGSISILTTITFPYLRGDLKQRIR